MTSRQTLTTARLALRSATPTDSGFVEELLQDAQVRAFLGGPVPPARLAQAVRANMTSTPAEDIWIVEARTDHAPLGLISLGSHKDGQDIELSYQFHPQTWGHGFASEAARAVLTYAKDIRHLPRVIAETQTANHRSTRLLTALGMREIAQVMRFGQPQTIFAT